ncbi:hypothetical protein SLEP1_g47509 [Rubroshorea leprosula]|uniref:Ubiquitin-like protease family profile domain-containing protein n=1 Tax=Rubroshorea leprosula TaxID=152421 RepID=A0AAV5LTI7_9ROSI|nr:hypothetical protein SLEP1_g47509 [Rubroshorea leprosula]
MPLGFQEVADCYKLRSCSQLNVDPVNDFLRPPSSSTISSFSFSDLNTTESTFSFFMIGAQHWVAVAVNVENRASFVFIKDFRIDNNDSTI